jgi:hypothetical protein
MGASDLTPERQALEQRRAEAAARPRPRMVAMPVMNGAPEVIAKRVATMEERAKRETGMDLHVLREKTDTRTGFLQWREIDVAGATVRYTANGRITSFRPTAGVTLAGLRQQGLVIEDGGERIYARYMKGL